MALRVAVVGATGNVGHEMLNILSERLFPADEVIAVASRRSIGKTVSYGDKEIKCHDIETFDFSTVDLCLMVGGRHSRKRMGAENRPARLYRDR